MGRFNASFNQLVRTLDTDREHVQNHTQWLQRAIAWKEKNQVLTCCCEGVNCVRSKLVQETEQQKKQPSPTDLQKAFMKQVKTQLLQQQKQKNTDKPKCCVCRRNEPRKLKHDWFYKKKCQTTKVAACSS
jgi:hypothetical protein